MPSQSAQTRINAAPQDVFAHIPALWTSYMEQVTAGNVAVGTRFALRLKGKTQFWDVTVYQPPQNFTMEYRPNAGGVPLVLACTVAPDAAGSTVRFVMSLSYSILTIIFKMGLFAPFILSMEWYGLRKIDLNERVLTLKSQVESFT